ncbi:glycyl-radical enzyme activating protein [Tetragenococcus koreensis]|uniref:glycyl-radical enzyme activating protein n=1 Tax=Tetragenococcus koreensis TaxID=290335 RepID=UPI000F4FB9B3|nr:glycyl-radical enzyme activating protein [Tetragenococcus koreensis]AYW44611.1 glycyl-radical enzyme activating protein [Tetragenococcus koreensis]MCF1616188.1 glycyl-radical enzyme activating protein [Tetragenococcus koreensis]MCF1621015.1 glycyl-radical enzyme activating protein [Tetragenococcus koreensis]MCF1626053.1 glycyl-radical enzyme activating protein [Tetragenococcus koreensis]MCF1677145.1 glycyl-radical enzyme activating protein [Tetragenococcus koreensis]
MPTRTSLQACIFNIQKFSIHDGPGIRTVVFFKGCPLRCYWCANPESQSGKPEKMWNNQQKKYTTIGEYKTIDEIIDEVMKDLPFYEESGGGVTLSGGEVLYQAEFATELLKQLKTKGIHTASETTGQARPQVFEKFIQQVDALYFDVKHYDPKKHREGIGATNKLILKNLGCALQEHQNLTVRIPVIPNFNDSSEDAEQFAHLFNKMGVTKIELLPFHQFGQKKYENLNRKYEMQDVPQLHTEDLDYFRDIIENYNISCLVR